MEITQTAGLNVERDSSNDNTYKPLDGVNEAIVEDGKTDQIIDSATSDRPPVIGLPPNKVEITQQDKMDFLDAVVTGARYSSAVSIFSGKVNVKFRARSLAETEAILAYMQHEGIAGSFTTHASVQDASLLALLVAQVAELNGVAYPEMKTPLLYTDSLSGVNAPAWVGDMEIWRSKPEALIAALGDALVEFEAKYWTMVKAAGDENFWNPDGSTEK